ncbi:MAG: xanthine dehydrogenase family protein [Alphaproteobacteria bacterium]|nr:xanthine dehydrogenase family protein [Alphaproteobacteria bacterium]
MAAAKEGFGVGASLKRKEDGRHLRGKAKFVADIQMPGALETAFVRSPHAHARIKAIRVPDDARDRVFTAADFPSLKPIRAVPSIPSFKASNHHPFPTDKVRFVGEAIALCLGETRAAAEDLAERVEVEYEELPAVSEMTAALAPDTVRVHDGWADNAFVERTIQGGDIEAARRAAAVTVTREYRMNRQSGAPLECRSVLAYWDDRTDELVVYCTTQSPHVMRVGFAEMLGLGEHHLRVVAPDVGGGFGVKNRLLAEELMIAAVAERLRAPVRWNEDRREHLLASVHAREHFYRVTAYADARGKLLGIDAEIIVDAGAYSLWPTGPFMETGMAARNLPGPYTFRHYRAKTWTVATNKSPLGPYRGVARPGACFAIERTIDEVARAVGRDPYEVRRDNMVTPDMMPYRTIAEMFFDNGDYPECLKKAAALIDLAGIRARQKRAEPDGRRIGVGFGIYAEQTAHGCAEWVIRATPIIPGYESATARLHADGSLVLLVGIHSHGQGMETTLAQIVHEELGIDPARVAVRYGDSALSPFGMGTFASRSIVMAGGATSNVCKILKEKIKTVGAHLMQCDPAEVSLEGGMVIGPTAQVSLAEIGRTAYLRMDALPPGTEPMIDATATYEPTLSSGVFSYATHAAVVAVDPTTGAVDLLDYAVVEDCGTIVNPMIVDGQIVGGVAQGIGTALFEEIPYDAHGQPQATTFADYLMPGATEIPDVKLGHMMTPAADTAYGMKGMGEGGAISPPAAIANALADAFAPEGAQFNETPFTPKRVRAAIAAAVRKAAAE